MADLAELKKKAAQLRKLARQAEQAAGGVPDAERMAAKRRAERDLVVKPVADPERRALLRDDDCEWLLTYFPHVFYHPFTPARKQLVEEIGAALRYGSRKCVAAPRGDGKSTITKYLSLKYGLERQVEFTLILAATGDKANKMLGDIKRQLRNPRATVLAADYPLETTVARYIGSAPARANNVTANGGRPIRVEWKEDLLVLPRFEDEGLGGIMSSLGITSDAVQGCNYNDIRPSFVILDDLDSRDSLAAVDGKVAGKIETIIDHTVAGLGGPGRRLGQVMLCTIPSRNSVAFRYSAPDQKPAWSGVRIPRIKSWPTAKSLWDEYIHKRQKGKATIGSNGKPVDPFGREAFAFYRDNFEAMNAGYAVSNEFDFESDEMPDGTPKHLSALQKCYDYIADNGMDSFLTEHQNDPPPDEADADRLVLTAHHIQHGCLSGTPKGIVPDGTVLLTMGADIRKTQLHWSAIAWSESAAGVIVDYGIFDFGTDGRAAADCELAILEGLWSWHQKLEESPFMKADGEIVDVDLCLIDMGWKEETWNTQPVATFCNGLDTFPHRLMRKFMPSKGIPNYRRPAASPTIRIGDNLHIDLDATKSKAESCFVALNSDHWKLKVHEGFLCAAGEPGSLLMYQYGDRDGHPNRTEHLSFSKHILSESWETKAAPGFRRPETKWWSSKKPNHYFDATYQAVAARAVRGLHAIAQSAPTGQPTPAPVNAPKPVMREASTIKQPPQVTTRLHDAGTTLTRRRIDFRRRG